MKIFIEHFREFLKGHPLRCWRELVWLIADATSAFIFFGGLISFSGYAFNVPMLYDGWFRGSVDISPQAALFFAFTGFCLLTIHRNQELLRK